jgi:hypothetical protein
MFSIVNRSPRRCKAFPPTATTKRCFFLGLEVVVVVVDAIEGDDSSTLGAANVEAEKNRADRALLRDTIGRCRNMVD